MNTMHTIVTKKQMTKVKREGDGIQSMRCATTWDGPSRNLMTTCNDIHSCSLLVVWFQHMGCMVAEHCCIQVKGGWCQEPLPEHA